MRYEYDAILRETPDDGGAYVAFPWDIRAEFGAGRVKVRAEFGGIPYEGSIVNMGVKNPDGSVCYVIGVRKSIRARLSVRDGDAIHVAVEPRQGMAPEERRSAGRAEPGGPAGSFAAGADAD